MQSTNNNAQKNGSLSEIITFLPTDWVEKILLNIQFLDPLPEKYYFFLLHWISIKFWRNKLQNCKIPCGYFSKNNVGSITYFEFISRSFLDVFSYIFLQPSIYSSISMFNIRFLCYRMPCLVCNIVGSLRFLISV